MISSRLTSTQNNDLITSVASISSKTVYCILYLVIIRRRARFSHCIAGLISNAIAKYNFLLGFAIFTRIFLYLFPYESVTTLRMAPR